MRISFRVSMLTICKSSRVFWLWFRCIFRKCDFSLSFLCRRQNHSRRYFFALIFSKAMRCKREKKSMIWVSFVMYLQIFRIIQYRIRRFLESSFYCSKRSLWIASISRRIVSFSNCAIVFVVLCCQMLSLHSKAWSQLSFSYFMSNVCVSSCNAMRVLWMYLF